MIEELQEQTQKERADKRAYLLMRLQKAGFSTDQAHALLMLVEGIL
jgi:hypothetical protein